MYTLLAFHGQTKLAIADSLSKIEGSPETVAKIYDSHFNCRLAIAIGNEEYLAVKLIIEAAITKL